MYLSIALADLFAAPMVQDYQMIRVSDPAGEGQKARLSERFSSLAAKLIFL